MRILSKLERKLGPYSVPNLTLALIICQVVMYLIAQAQLQGQPQGAKPEILEKAELVPRLVLQGEVWRVITFLAVPPLTNPIFAVFGWYLFYLMGTALEVYWGIFRYNIFLLIGY